MHRMRIGSFQFCKLLGETFLGKQIKRKLASIVLATAMILTLLPTGVMADDYDNGDLSMFVDY